MVGYTEVLTWILCSSKEISTMLNREDDKTAAINGNPRSADFEVQSTSDVTFSPIFLFFFFFFLSFIYFVDLLVSGCSHQSYARHLENRWAQ